MVYNTYDACNRLLSEISKNAAGTTVQSYTYTLDANGNRTTCEELSRTIAYSYDALGRLTGETVTAGADISATSYTYDANSNRTSKTANGVVTAYTYNNLNQMTQAGDITYTYSDAGNLVSQTQSGILIASYTYDSRTRIDDSEVTG